jgi:hypothetical protein
MKGQPEALIEQAVLQARRDADLLYQLVVNANVEVVENGAQREREYVFLLGYLSAEIHGSPTKDRVQIMRMAFLRFLDRVIILDAAIRQLASERLNGEPMLFRDCAVNLQEQLQMADRLSGYFNSLARLVCVPEIELEELRANLQSETDRQVSTWINLARLAGLVSFGSEEEIHAAMDRFWLLLASRSDETPKTAVAASSSASA